MATHESSPGGTRGGSAAPTPGTDGGGDGVDSAGRVLQKAEVFSQRLRHGGGPG
jgi:hypothetical protein